MNGLYTATRDHFKLLGIPMDSNMDDIKKAYRKQARKHHPDVNGGDDNTFKKVVEAYEVLSDRTKREHDQESSGWGSPFGNQYTYDNHFQEPDEMEMREIFKQFGFGSFGTANKSNESFDDFFSFRRENQQKKSKKQRKRKKNGSKVTVSSSLSFMEAISGVTRDIVYTADIGCSACKSTGCADGKHSLTCKSCNGTGTKTKIKRSYLIQQQCPDCGGTGETIKKPCRECSGTGKARKRCSIKVDIPQGIDDGESIKLKRKGNIGENGGETGDLVIEIKVLNHPTFTRNNLEIHSNYDLSITQAIFGATLDIPTIHGLAPVYAKSGTKPGEQSVLRGKGIISEGKSSGNHIIHWGIKIPDPSSLTDAQKDLLEQYAKLEKE